MNPPKQPEPDSLAALERKVLSALCQGTLEASVRDRALQQLKQYAWREPVHRAIFQCLAQVPAGNFELVHSELPACLTRKGFPDVDWDLFFMPHSMTRQQAEQAVLDLLSSNAAHGNDQAGASHPSEKS